MSERQRGTTIYRPIIYGNTSFSLTPENRGNSPLDHTHRWTIALRSAASPPDGRGDTVGGADDISYFVKRVAFKLHETYPSPNRTIEKPPFEVTESGWGEFEVQIRVTFVNESNEKPISFHHHLKLHQWGAKANQTPGSETPTLPAPEGPVNAWQYEEIVFSDPTQNFLNILLAHPPTPLPKIKRKAAPPHIAYPPSLVPYHGMPEFTTVMEREEAERLDNAKRDIVEQTDKLRVLLIEKEKELERLKKEVEGQPKR